MSSIVKPPLILTLALEEQGFQFFQALRQRHFPPERNFIDAHLTLFHALPNEEHISASIQKRVNGRLQFVLKVTKPVSIGNGVAFRIESAELMQLHQSLQNEWRDRLYMQDRQTLWPHITIQNKVPAPEAKTLLGELTVNFTPFNITATGLQLWEYLNGPWRLVQVFDFNRIRPGSNA